MKNDIKSDLRSAEKCKCRVKEKSENGNDTVEQNPEKQDPKNRNRRNERKYETTAHVLKPDDLRLVGSGGVGTVTKFHYGNSRYDDGQQRGIGGQFQRSHW